MNETPKIVAEKDKWKAEPYNNLQPKQIAAMTLLEHSQLNQGQIAKALGYNPAYFTTVKNKLEKHSLTSPQMRKKAFRAIKETLDMIPSLQTSIIKGQQVTMDVYPTHSNRLTAAQMVADRTEPVVNRTESVSVSFSKIDLTSYKDESCVKKEEGNVT